MTCVIRNNIRSVGLHRCNVANEIGVVGKGKIHPRTGHDGPEGKMRYSSTLS